MGPMYGHPLATYPTALNSLDNELVATVALCRELPLDDQAWIELIPAGDIVGRDGRKWVNSNPDGIIAAFAANQAMLPVDLEHATQLKSPRGEPAPAVGWIEELQVRTGAIWGRVAWNQEGKDLLQRRAYRYYSPTFTFNPDTLEVVGLKSAALTNRPNLYVDALNQTTDINPDEGVNGMDLSKIALALALAANASQDDILAAIGQLVEDKNTALNAAAHPDPQKFVPIETHETALNRAQEAEQKLQDQVAQALNAEIDSAVESAIEDGKIAPANREYYVAMCRTEGGLDKFKEFVQSAPKVVPEQGGGDKSSAPAGQQPTALNSEEEQVAKMLGMTNEDFAKAKQELAAATA